MTVITSYDLPIVAGVEGIVEVIIPNQSEIFKFELTAKAADKLAEALIEAAQNARKEK